MAKRLTYEEVKHYIEIESKSDCKLLSTEYKNNYTPLLIKCNCGRVFETAYRSFKYQNVQKCNVCSGVMYDVNYVKSFIANNSRCNLISKEYISINDNMLFQCECGNYFNTTFYNFMHQNKRHCDECGMKNSANKQKFSYDFVKSYIEGEYGNGCKLLSKNYVNNRAKLQIKCKCETIFYTNFSNFKDKGKKQCNSCSNLIDWSYLSVNHFIKSESNCKLLSKGYVNNITRMRFLCECGNEFITTFAKFKDRGKRQCSECGYGNKTSYGEAKIKDYLDRYEINYKQEYSFGDLVGVSGGLLRFDFAIFDNINNLELLIEYDGEFHFKKYFEEQNFKELQIHDERKNQYCKDNNIPLLRIPYWEFDNIEIILGDWLNKYELLEDITL